MTASRNTPICGQLRLGFGADGGNEAGQVAEDVARLEFFIDVLVRGERLGLRKASGNWVSECGYWMRYSARPLTWMRLFAAKPCLTTCSVKRSSSMPS